MIFWIVAGLLALVALAAVTVPVLRGRAEARRAADYDIEVYRDQLAEVERNQKRGMIGAAEAEAAKAEIGRRILAADQRRARADSAGEGGNKGLVRAAAVVVGLAIPVGAVAVYLAVGRPGLEGMPLASRDIAAEQQTAQRPSGGQSGSGQSGSAQSGGSSLAEAEAQLAKKLEEQPQNLQGWILLGRTRQQMGNHAAAAEAFQQARELAPEDAQVQAMYGEALVMANQGSVTPQAQEAFRAVLEQQPQDPRSRFYLGLAAQQAGQPEEALERWKALVADADPGAAYLGPVGQQMAEVEAELGIEPGTTFAEVKPEAPAGSGDGADGAPSGPTQEQMQQAQEMSPEQQQEMIRGMVDRLAGRLEENPDDLQGWLQLARSYEVLEQPAKAVEAYARAAELAPQDPEVLRRYARALRAEAGQPSEQSVAVTRRLLEVQPNNPEALWFTALAELSEGDKERARELFDRAIAELPQDTPQTAELRKRADELLQQN